MNNQKRMKALLQTIKEYNNEKEHYEAPLLDSDDYKIIEKVLEKQLPKKPIIKTEEEVPHTHDLGRLLSFHCPNCGRFIVGLYEKDYGISNNLKGCFSCLQAIDFSEYYTKRIGVNNERSKALSL